MMRGHTNNRVLRACLKSIQRNATKEAERRDHEDPTREYHLGRADAAREIEAQMLGNE